MSERVATAILLCVTAIGCAAPQRVFRWEETLASRGWAGALAAVAHDCGDPAAPKDACPPGDLEAAQRMRQAREDAYAKLLATHPVRLVIGVATRDEMGALTGYPIPADADEHTMVVACRVQISAMPAGVTWDVASASAFMARDLPESYVYRDHTGEDPEGFIVALGGAARPSSLERWKRSTPFESVEEFRKMRLYNPILDQDRYGIPYPTKTTSAPAPAKPTLTQQVAKSDSTGLVSLATAPVTMILDLLDLLSPASSGVSSPEYTAWAAQIREKRAAENAEWSRDPHVAALVRLWGGAWAQPQGAGTTEREVIATYGYEVDRPRGGVATAAPVVPPTRLREEGLVVLVLRPVVEGKPLPEIAVEVKIPRQGDLRDDLEAFAKTGPHAIESWSGRGVAHWLMNAPSL